MKILQIINPVMPFPPKTIGGTERVVKYLVDELVNDGHDVTLLCHDESEYNSRIKTIGIGTYLDQKKTPQKVWKHLLLNKYDVIHNHGRLLYFLPETWSATRKVHTFHMAELESRSFHNFIKLRPRNLTFAPCAKWIQTKYQHIKVNWSYINNGIPKDLYSYNDKIGGADGPLVLVCRISPGKGVSEAIEVALKTKKKLIIAGKVGDYPHEKEWFSQNVEQYCGDQVQYAGVVDDNQKQALLEKASALLMLSADSEAFNLTMLEANACGCPVIAYNRFFPPDFIKQGINGFIGDTQSDIIEAIGKLNTIDRSKCRADFEANYTAKIMTENYLRLYRSKV